MEGLEEISNGFLRSQEVYNTSLVNAKCRLCSSNVRNGTIAVQENNFNPKHRGNETQFHTVVCKKCSKEIPAMIDYLRNKKIETKKNKELKIKIKKVEKYAKSLGVYEHMFETNFN